jgi:type I restriction enzyme S subunit
MSLGISAKQVVDESDSQLLAIAPWWERVCLGDIADVQNGAPFDSSMFNREGDGLPLIRIRDVGSSDTETYFSGTFDGSFIVRAGDVLIGMDGDFRIARWAGRDALLNQRVCRVILRAGTPYDERFLVQVLQPYLDEVKKRTSSVTVKHLSSKTVAELPIPLPPQQEQRRLVDELEKRLSHVDAAVAGLTAALQRLSAARNAVLWALILPKGVGETVNGLQSLPDGWEWKTLVEVAEVVGGVTKDSKRQADPSFVDVPYLRVANVQRGFLDLDEVATIRVHPDKAKSLRLQDGDILFNEGGDRDKLGRGWVWEDQVPECIHQNHVFRARLHDSRLEPKFVSWVGNTFGRRWFESAGKQTTNLASINKKTLESFPVPVPPDGVAVAIVAEGERRVSLIDAAEQTVAANLRKAETLRRSVLAAAFSGRLVHQDPADEPASALLERIKARRVSDTDAGPKGTGKARAKKSKEPTP